MSVSDRIKELRKKHGLKQDDLAKILGVSRSTISNYENDEDCLNPAIIVKIMKYFAVDANFMFQDHIDKERYRLKEEENYFVNEFRTLDRQGQRVVFHSMDGESQRMKEEGNTDEDPVELERPLYTDLNEFAASGILTSFPYRLPDKPQCREADFIFRMPDNSMEPVFVQGDMLLGRNATNLNYGEIGIFLVNDEIVIRKYATNGLYAENPAFPSFDEKQEYQCLARVIDKLEFKKAVR